MSDVLAIKGSPRANGNTDLLVDAAAKGASEAGHRVTVIKPREMDFVGCVACGGCHRDGTCHVKDAMQDIFALLDGSRHIIVGSPVFFMGIPWKLKGLIDRCQLYWARKFVLHVPSGRRSPGGNILPLMVGGTDYRTLFDASTLVLRSWAATLEMKLMPGLALRNIDAKGEILKHPDLLSQATEMGRKIETGE